VEKHFKSVWDPIAAPKNTYVPPKQESSDNTFKLEGDFAEWMQKEDEIRACLKPKHNLSALGLDGVCYIHLKFEGDPMIKLLSLIFKDCVAHRPVSRIWKCSRTVLLYKKGKEYTPHAGTRLA
jgi:hypothetical protein